MAEPYLLNCWYQAGFSEEITAAPLARTILDAPLVLFRSHDRAAALRDLCPHRSAPLSQGVVKDGAVVCGYHGLVFGAEGQCLHNPHSPISRSLVVQAFPIVERHGVVWI
jgi:vanillate O-demethylase monooxygenase subunit